MSDLVQLSHTQTAQAHKFSSFPDQNPEIFFPQSAISSSAN